VIPEARSILAATRLTCKTRERPAHANESSRCRTNRQLQSVCSLGIGVGLDRATYKANTGHAKRNAASLCSRLQSRMRATGVTGVVIEDSASTTAKMLHH
jgi:hypothetical protein